MELYYSPTISLEEIFNNIKYCVAICTADMTTVGINKPFAQLHGCEPKDLIGKKATDIYPDFKKSVFYECCMETIKTGNTITRVGYSVPLQGWYAIRTLKYSNDYYVLIGHEISNDKSYAGLVPIYDSVTSLYNRHKFEDDLTLKIANKNQFGLIIIDILKLKKINEIYGIFHADMLLMEIAGKLRMKYKDPALEFYKISPDKFAITSDSLKEPCLSTIHETSKLFNEQYKICNDVIKINIAIGFNYFNDFKKDLQAFIQETENAVNLAKSQKTLYFEHNDNIHLLNKKDLINEIKDALKNNEFTLYYQPQMDCLKNKICGAEALIRWNHPTKGILAPGYFLDLIEEFELNHELDRYVMKQVFKDFSFFKANKIPLPISFNLSTSSLSDDSIVDYFEKESKKIDIDNDLLTVEINESSLIESVEKSKKIITNFAAKGLKIAIDDFGAGYSSFGYLVRYPTDYLKIDRQFITNIHQKNNLKEIVLNLIKMAHSLNMLVVAEGVEIEEEAQILKKYGCDIIQGYFYGRPMTKEQLVDKIQKKGFSNFKSDFC